MQKPCCNKCQQNSVSLKRCGNCKTVHYCCKECQLQAWPNHKLLCKRLTSKHQKHVLVLAAAEGENTYLSYLLKKTTDNINAPFHNSMTKLMISSEFGFSRCINLLQHMKAKHNLINKYNMTALFLAVVGNHEECVRLLLKANADPNILCTSEMISPLMVACKKNLINCVKLLLEYKADVELRNMNGENALNICSYKGHDKCVHLLLQYEANPNVICIDKLTPLHYSCLMGHFSCIVLLTQNGADVNVIDKDGYTPLMRCVYVGKLNSVKYLCDHGANVNISNNNGHTSLQFAYLYGFNEIVDVILAKGAFQNSINGMCFGIMAQVNFFI